MTIEIALLVSIVSVCASVFFGLKNHKRADTKEVQQEAEDKAETKIMLRQISTDVSDMKGNMNSMRDSLRDLTGQVALVERSVKRAHERIDKITDDRREDGLK